MNENPPAPAPCSRNNGTAVQPGYGVRIREETTVAHCAVMEMARVEAGRYNSARSWRQIDAVMRNSSVWRAQP